MRSVTFGKRLAPQVVDELAKSEPESVWSGIPVDDDDLSKGYRYYTFAQLANAVNWLAHYLDQQLGGPSLSSETITYIGPNDMRYIVVVLAAIKTGRKALLVSTKNSLDAQLNLFEKTDTHAVLHAASFKDVVVKWLENRSMASIAIPDERELMNMDTASAYPYTKTWDEAHSDTFVVLHTSGSTGFPKPIDVKMGLMAIMDAFHDLPDFDGRQNWVKWMANEASSIFVSGPLFHATALYMMIGFGVFWKLPILVPPPSKPVSASTIEACIRHSGTSGAFMAPSLLEELSTNNSTVELMASLRFVGVGSGNVATNIGNALVESGVCLMNILGATENAPLPIYKQDLKDWAYFCMNDDPCGLEWRHVGSKVYELFIVRKDKTPGLQGCFYTFPDLEEWSTRDLYRKHPTRPNNWIYHGRADNVIVFANGEKLNPISIEDEITGHPKVKGALVIGRDRLQPALLVEPVRDCEDREEQGLLDELWPWVVRANAVTVAHGQIARPYITLTPRGKAFPRSGKDMIQRAMAETMFQKEVDQLYETAEQAQMETSPDLDMESAATLTESLRQMIKVHLDLESIGENDDFFSKGMDSLKAMALARALTGSIRRAIGDVPNASLTTPRDLYRVLYEDPTPRQLADYILSRLDSPSKTAPQPANVDVVMSVLEKYTKDLSPVEILKHPSPPATSNLTVVLTGSTGSIGSYILDQLNNNQLVGKIITLNRGPDPRARQIKSSASRGLSTDFHKTIFLTSELSQPRLGLSDGDYQTLLDEADAILHSQWPVDFNLSLSSFTPHIHGVRRLVDLSTASTRRPRIVFVTTIAEAMGWSSPDSSSSIPEEALPHHTIPGEKGYGAGKLAASLVLQKAAEVSGITTAIVRVGQVAGPVDLPHGSWNRREWFPSIVASSIHLRCLPQTIGVSEDADRLFWVPVERQAELLVDVTLSAGSGYFNGVNPHCASYTHDILPILKQSLATKIDNVVSFPEWVARLADSQSSIQTNEQVEENPGVKLLTYYESLTTSTGKDSSALRWVTAKSQEISTTWQRLEPVQPEWMKLWLQQWGFS